MGSKSPFAAIEINTGIMARDGLGAVADHILLLRCELRERASVLRQLEERIIPETSLTSQLATDHPCTLSLTYRHATSGVHQHRHTTKDRLPLVVRHSA